MAWREMSHPMRMRGDMGEIKERLCKINDMLEDVCDELEEMDDSDMKERDGYRERRRRY